MSIEGLKRKIQQVIYKRPNILIPYLLEITREKLSMALLTMQFALFAVDLDVFVQVCFLGKRLSALRFTAHKWSLSGMNSEVVEKIMPFSEDKIAIFKVTTKQLDITISLWVLIFEHFESFSLWNSIF